MNDAAQPLTEDDQDLSPWWLRTMLIVLVVGFSGLIAITVLGYRSAPPIPAQVVDTQGNTLFSGSDINRGQEVFLKYGLMDNGSIWGHGAYLGPDYSAEALHRIGQDTATAIARQQYGKPMDALSAGQQHRQAERAPQ
jgi:nitric oxide reductase subunit B